MSTLNQSTSDPPFERTTCACDGCTKLCKRQPGPLASRDFIRIQRHLQVTPDALKEKLWASPGALVKDGYGKVERIGTITPQFQRGRCVFLDANDRCSIHPVAPFGCAYFDTHMSNVTANPRSIWLAKDTLNPEYQALRRELPYARSYKPTAY